MSRVAVERARASAAGVSPERSEHCEAMSLEVCSMRGVRLHALAQHYFTFTRMKNELPASAGDKTVNLALPSAGVSTAALQGTGHPVAP